MFVHNTAIRLHNTDAAGLLFFADQFQLAHDAYESFMESIGYPFVVQFRSSNYLLPIVHAEADFLKPLLTGDRITIHVVAARIGDTSFTLAYKLLRNESELVGTVRTVHVLTDKRDGRKRPLLPEFREKLNSIAQ